MYVILRAQVKKIVKPFFSPSFIKGFKKIFSSCLLPRHERAGHKYEEQSALPFGVVFVNRSMQITINPPNEVAVFNR